MVGAVGAQSTRAFWQRSIFVSTKNSGGRCGNLSVNILLRRLLKGVIQCRFPWICLDLFFQTSLFPSVDQMDPNRVCLCHTCSKSRENVPSYRLDFQMSNVRPIMQSTSGASGHECCHAFLCTFSLGLKALQSSTRCVARLAFEALPPRVMKLVAKTDGDVTLLLQVLCYT